MQLMTDDIATFIKQSVTQTRSKISNISPESQLTLEPPLVLAVTCSLVVVVIVIVVFNENS